MQPMPVTSPDKCRVTDYIYLSSKGEQTMEIIKKYPADLDSRTAYKMMKSPDVKKMSDAEGSILEVNAWINYTDIDSKTGEVKEILVVETEDKEMFGTVSPTFQREFKDIVDFFGDAVGAIKVISGKSKSGRTFITCTVE